MSRKGAMQITGMAILFILFTSCRKDLCYDHNHAANVDIAYGYNKDWCTHQDPSLILDPEWEMDWETILPKEPDGVRLITYPHYQGITGQTYNMTPQGGKIQMSSGMYNMLFYNNDTEYIIFNGSGHETMATTRTQTRVSYSKLYPDEVTVNSPDLLYAAFFDELEIEESDIGETKIQKTLDVQLSPRVFSYIVRIQFKAGLEYVALARGALSGMSGSVNLATGNTTDDPVTLFFECSRKQYGWETIFRSFGVPGITFEDTKAGDGSSDITRGDQFVQYNRDEGTKTIVINQQYDHRLTLELYLINGKEKVVTIDVTDQVNQQPRGGVIVIDGLEVTEEEGQESSGGGFDTEVDGWEDDKVVDIPIN